MNDQPAFPYERHPDLVYAVIQQSSPSNSRNDTASVARLCSGDLIAVWHAHPNQGCKYRTTARGSSDFGRSDIASKISQDEGRPWGPERLLVEADPADNNVQAPALRRLRGGLAHPVKKCVISDQHP